MLLELRCKTELLTDLSVATQIRNRMRIWQTFWPGAEDVHRSGDTEFPGASTGHPTDFPDSPGES